MNRVCKFLNLLLIVGLLSSGLLGQTTTPNLGLTKPALGVTGWGSTLNTNLDTLDAIDIPPYAVGAGTAQAQTITLAPAVTALNIGLTVRWLPVAANTAAAPTLSVSNLTAKAVTKCGTTALVANDLTTTSVALAVYDGSQFQLINPQSLGCGGVPTGPITSIPSSDTISAAGVFATTVSVPGTYLAVGSLLTVTAHGVFTTSATATPRMAMRVNAGGTTAICPSVTNMNGSLTINVTNGYWELTCRIQINTTGNPGTAITWGWESEIGTGGGNMTPHPFLNPGTVSYITTSAQSVSIEETDTLVAGQSFTLQSIVVNPTY